MCFGKKKKKDIIGLVVLGKIWCQVICVTSLSEMNSISAEQNEFENYLLYQLFAFFFQFLSVISISQVTKGKLCKITCDYRIVIGRSI